MGKNKNEISRKDKPKITSRETAAYEVSASQAQSPCTQKPEAV